MEGFNMNNINQHKAEAPSVPEATGHMEVGLDGKEFFVHAPRKISKESDEEIIAEAELIPEQADEVAKIISPILRDAVSQGAIEGWDTDKPSELFVERVGAEIEKIVKERAPGWKEADTVYDLLRSELLPLKNEREKKMKDALLKRASSGKYAH